jgi:putative glycosyltransferase (TIGR04372 family)
MGMIQFIKGHAKDVQRGGTTVNKIKLLFRKIFKLPLYIFAIPAVLIMRLIKPLLLLRLGGLISSRIGHFALNTELYLCEYKAGINEPSQRHIDIFYMGGKPLCNQQLSIMWHRLLRIWPTLILGPIANISQLIPGGKLHEIGSNTQNDRDVHNLLDRFPPHIKFTTEEESRGEAGLRAIGITEGAMFVCLIVRDSGYLDSRFANNDWNYHNFRDCDVQNFVLAAEELAKRGFFVIRMGAKVHEAINSAHPKVIDYATNGMRSDFMDIYLGAKCEFCISVGTGFDAVPIIFRRPIAYVNMVPVGYFFTFCNQILGIFKHHLDACSNRKLSLSEIFARGAGHCLGTSDYETKGVVLIENTPEEIRDVAIEMAERLAGTWPTHSDDKVLQSRFWEIFPTEAVDAYAGKQFHGELRSRFGASFLRNNQWWLN